MKTHERARKRTHRHMKHARIYTYIYIYIYIYIISRDLQGYCTCSLRRESTMIIAASAPTMNEMNLASSVSSGDGKVSMYIFAWELEESALACDGSGK